MTTIALVTIPTIVALYYMVKANRPNRREVVIRLKLDQQPENTDATQTEWEFKQYHKN